ncbi:unnamed protein product, partial [Allacma fusca]
FLGDTPAGKSTFDVLNKNLLPGNYICTLLQNLLLLLLLTYS